MSSKQRRKADVKNASFSVHEFSTVVLGTPAYLAKRFLKLSANVEVNDPKFRSRKFGFIKFPEPLPWN